MQDQPAWSFVSGQLHAQLYSVAGAGNIDGDAYDDVVVGANLYDSHRTDVGKAWVFHGSDSGPSVAPSWSDTAQVPLGRFGWVAPAGDVNGDTYDDVLVGAFGDDRVYLYLGSASGLNASVSDGDCAR